MITLDQIESAIQATLDGMEEGVEYVISKSHLEKINKARMERGWSEWERNNWRWRKENGKLYESDTYICEVKGLGMETVMLMVMVMATVMVMVTVMVFMLGEIEPLEKELTLGDLKPGDRFHFAHLNNIHTLLAPGSKQSVFSAVEYPNGSINGVLKSMKVVKVES